MKETTTHVPLSQFLLRRLKEIGCDDIFGVPGDFVLGFFNEILKSEVRYVGTCNELNAAYAADGYARIKSIGAVTTTYSVGELSAINGIAGSFAENVSVVKITGIPATKFFRKRALLHHTLGDYEAAYKMYKQITAEQTILSNPETAANEIDRVLRACLRNKLPVYIGIPSDMVVREIEVPIGPFIFPKQMKSDPGPFEEAIKETLKLLQKSKRPLFIPGIEITRNNLTSEFKELLAASGIPYATMMLSKALIDEDHEQFIGLYSGDRSRKYVQERVESADCLVILGEKLTDFNTGGFSAQMYRQNTIEVFHDYVQIMFHVFNHVYIHDFIRELAKRISFRPREELDITPASQGCVHRSAVEFVPNPNEKLSMHRMFHRMAHFIKPGSVVIAETGASLFSAAEVMLPKNTKFLGQTFYGSIGYTVGACLGVCVADPKKHVYLFVGDGSFQVTCQDLSTMIRYGCKPVVFLVNNDGYTIERVIVDRPYNDIQPWKYHMLVDVFGGGKSYDCFTEGQLEASLEAAETSNADVLNFIEVHLDRFDCNNALKKAGRSMALSNRLLEPSQLEELKEKLESKHKPEYKRGDSILGELSD